MCIRDSSRASPRLAIIQEATGLSIPPESRETAVPPTPTGNPPAPGVGLAWT